MIQAVLILMLTVALSIQHYDHRQFANGDPNNPMSDWEPLTANEAMLHDALTK